MSEPTVPAHGAVPEPARSNPELLARWLRSRGEETIRSHTSWEAPADGRPREVMGQIEVDVLGPEIALGGQAAVTRVRLVRSLSHKGEIAALRLELGGAGPAEAYRREVMMQTAWLSRNVRERFPALIRVHHSFYLDVPDGELAPGRSWHQGASTRVWMDVMEWGTPLTRHLREHPRPTPHEAAALLLPVLETIRDLHAERDLVHQDLDEDNVLVTADGRLAVTDWGASTTVQADRTHTVTGLAGKLARRPPDLTDDGHRVTGRFTDTWLLGRLLLVVATGAPGPYRDPLDPDPVAAHRWHPAVAGLPDPLARLVRMMCAPERSRRTSLARATELLRAFVEAEPGTPEPTFVGEVTAARARPVAAAPPTPAPTAAPTAAPRPAPTPASARRRRPWLVTAVTGLVVLVLGGVVGPVVGGLASGLRGGEVDDYVIAAVGDPVGFYRVWVSTGVAPVRDDAGAWVTAASSEDEQVTGGVAVSAGSVAHVIVGRAIVGGEEGQA